MSFGTAFAVFAVFAAFEVSVMFLSFIGNAK